MSYCFRHEPSDDAGRMQMFRMHEHVRAADPESVMAGAKRGSTGRSVDRGSRTRRAVGSGLRSVFRPRRQTARGQPARPAPQARDRHTDRQRRAADGDHLAQLPPGPFRPSSSASAPPTARWRTPRASASGWSGSPWPSIGGTASTATDMDRRPCARRSGCEASSLGSRRQCLCAPSASLRRSRVAGVQLLRRPLGGAAPHRGRRAARGAAVRARGGRRGRSVDVLQVSCSPISTRSTACTVFELNVWRSLAAHVAEQLALGRPSIVEVDAFYLPDTAGTSYRSRARQDVDRDPGSGLGRPAARLLPQRAATTS